MIFYNYGEIIANRYQIIAILGQGGIATTYRALDTNTNTEVAIKTISLKGIGDWKQIELFEREAKILQQLNCPSIPKYIDYFEIDTQEDRYFYLVQQIAPGQSLLLYFIFVKGFVDGLWSFIFLLVVAPLFFIRFWFFKKKITIYLFQENLEPNPKPNSILIVNHPLKAYLKQYNFPLIKKYFTYCILASKQQNYSFGFLLSNRENKWLVREINSFLASEHL